MVRKLINKIFHFEPINGGGECPAYLYRWTLFAIGEWFRIYLHQFVGDDWARDPHDHPKRFISIGLYGWYLEEVFNREGTWMETRRFDAPWVRTFPAEHVHRIRASEHGNTWTIVIVFKPHRPWGFIQDKKWIRWDRYVLGGASRKSC